MLSVLHSLSWLNIIPLCGSTAFYLSMHQSLALWVFRCLAIVNNAAVNMHDTPVFSEPRKWGNYTLNS